MLTDRPGQFMGQGGPVREHMILIDHGYTVFCDSYKTSRKASIPSLVTQQASSMADSDNGYVLRALYCGSQSCCYWMVSTGRHGVYPNDYLLNLSLVRSLL